MSVLNALDLRRHAANGGVVRNRSESAEAGRVALEGCGQPVRVRPLEVALDALGAQHPLVEGEFLPGFETDDDVVLNLELDAALLATEATMRFDELFRVCGGLQAFSS